MVVAIMLKATLAGFWNNGWLELLLRRLLKLAFCRVAMIAGSIFLSRFIGAASGAMTKAAS